MENKILHGSRGRNVVYLIDGSAFLYRAYHSLPYMTAKDGTPVRVVYGFCRILKKFIEDVKPVYMAVAWDTPSEFSSFRRQLYPLYKANRALPPEELNRQRDLVKEFSSLIGLAQFELANEEADDVLYSLAHDFVQQGCFVVTVSSDKDLCQTISKDSVVYDRFKNIWIDEKGVKSKFGVPVEKLLFYFSLVGDAVDNIPGVPGIGMQTAQKLVHAYDSLEDLYKRIDTVESPSIQNLLETHEREAFLSEKLFRLYYHDFNVKYSACAFDAANWRRARDFFEDLNFESLLKE